MRKYKEWTNYYTYKSYEYLAGEDLEALKEGGDITELAQKLYEARVEIAYRHFNDDVITPQEHYKLIETLELVDWEQIALRLKEQGIVEPKNSPLADTVGEIIEGLKELTEIISKLPTRD
jgi:hypothetical protein